MYILAGPIIHCLLRACVYKLNYVYIYVCYWSFSAHAMLRSRKGTCYTSRMSRTTVSRPGRLYPLRLYTTTHSPMELSYVNRTSQCAEWVSRREQVIVVLLFSGNKKSAGNLGTAPLSGSLSCFIYYFKHGRINNTIDTASPLSFKKNATFDCASMSF